MFDKTKWILYSKIRENQERLIIQLKREVFEEYKFSKTYINDYISRIKKGTLSGTNNDYKEVILLTEFNEVYQEKVKSNESLYNQRIFHFYEATTSISETMYLDVVVLNCTSKLDQLNYLESISKRLISIFVTPCDSKKYNDFLDSLIYETSTKNIISVRELNPSRITYFKTELLKIFLSSISTFEDCVVLTLDLSVLNNIEKHIKNVEKVGSLE
jgi:hypothetical protein